MKNLILIIALSLSATSFSQTTLIMNDLKYNEGIDTKWSVLYMPDHPETKSEYLEENDQWLLKDRGDHRSIVLKPTKPGMYMVTQELDDVIIQISSISID